ncbi:AAA family ATPase [Streptomyces sp. NPDC050485]|uniref:AAA family ATPase n=1 Tax=Streptomyces sp. NPDC050485 TaxID=3365617 RepID=UPI00378B60B2
MTSLIERTAELQVLDAALGRALGGDGTAVLIDGPAGIGKSALLAEAATRVREHETWVLRAHCCPQEARTPWAAVRQLLDPCLGDEDHSLLDGTQGLSPTDGNDGADLPFDRFHHLYLTLLRLSRQAPLVLLVDDAQHADELSQQWLAYLARRLHGARIALAVAARTAPGAAGGVLVAELEACPDFSRLRPRPLSGQGTAHWLADKLGPTLDVQTADVCHRAVGGHPGLLAGVVEALARTGSPAAQITPEHAAVICDRALLRALPTLLNRHASAVTAVATAVTALDRVADLPLLARTTGIDAPDAEQAVTALEDAGLLHTGPPWQLTSAAIAQALTAQAGEQTLNLLRSRAAEALGDLGADASEVADVLLRTAPDGQTWRVPVLHEAARTARELPDPPAARRYLLRALAEPPTDTDRPPLLALLGTIEVHLDPEAAVGHLRAALADEEDTGVRVGLVPSLAEALARTGRAEEAVALLDELAGRIDEGDRETLYRLWAKGILVLLEETPQVADAWIARSNIADDLAGTSSGQRLLLAALALKTTLTGQCAHTAAHFADRALARPAPREEPALTAAFATAALLHADRLVDAAHCCDQLLGDTTHSQPAPLRSLFMAMRAKIAHRMGDLASALTLSRQALALAPVGQRYQPYVTAQLIHALLDLGDAEEAEHICHVSYQGPADNHWSWAVLYAARARTLHVHHRHQDALGELDACARQMQEGGYDNPALVPWRSHAALVHQRLGNDDTARDLADEELVLARRWGSPHTIATSLRALGRLRTGAKAVTALSEATALLEATPARYALALALADLGEALHGVDRLAEARSALRQALDLADASGAIPLSERAHRALVATGARPRRRRQSGVSALTEGEQRIATLAATGMDNQAIAAALYVSRRTVEFHLTHVYRKLAIDGRVDLGAALADGQIPPPRLPEPVKAERQPEQTGVGSARMAPRAPHRGPDGPGRPVLQGHGASPGDGT